MTNLAKLDCYDYFLLPGIIQIELESTNDPTMVDILSEIERSNGRIYVEGRYFIMAGYDLFQDGGTFLNLKVANAE